MTRKRRGFGEGSIYQRKSGRWAGVISLGHGAKRKAVYGKTKREVQDKLNRLQLQKTEGTLADERTEMTVGELFDRWLNSTKPPRVAPRTFEWYSWIEGRFIRPRIGKLQLSKVTPLTIEAMYSAMEQSGVSGSMRGSIHKVLRRAMNQAVKWKCIPNNPIWSVEAPKGEPREINPLNAEQAKALCVSAESHRLHAIFVLAVTTGMRMGELFAIHWEDIDLERKLLTVKYTLEEIRGKLRLKAPKSKSGKRCIVLPEITVQALHDHRARMMTEGLAGERLVFLNARGDMLRQSNFSRRVWKPIRAAAGIPEVRFHDLRHTHATLLLEQGVHPKVVQERLGHSSIRLTLDTYSHVSETLQSEAVEKLDRAFA